jgi:hypothetical protein
MCRRRASTGRQSRGAAEAVGNGHPSSTNALTRDDGVAARAAPPAPSLEQLGFRHRLAPRF